MSLRILWRRVAASIASRIRQRVTLAGVGFSFLVSVAGALAFLSGNNLLFLILGCLLATLLLSGFISRLSLAGLELDFVFPEHVSARRRVPARMKLRNEKTWMPSFSIHVSGVPGSVFSSNLYFPVLPGGSTVEEMVEVEFARRGQHKEDGFRLRSAFPFGLTERQVQVTLRREALVYPCLDGQPGFETVLHEVQGEMAAIARDRGNDFYRIRPYEHLESARHVDWKATAHTGQLQVREFAREQDPMVEIFLDLDLPLAQYGWFERAVDLAAYLSWATTARGARLLFRTQTFDVEVPSQGDIYVILKYLALVEPIRTNAVPGPGREDSVHVVLSPSPSRLLGAGWSGNHVVGPDVLGAPTTAGPAGARAGSKLDHRR